MKSRGAYVLTILVGLALLMTVRYFRHSDANVPGWLYLVGLVFVPFAIWMDIKSRRKDDAGR